MKVNLLSLGCAKNLADSEGLLRGLRAAGLAYTPDPAGADLVLVNTCGFIEEAKRESVEEILEVARAKKGRRLVVMGCLAKRYCGELKREVPEIDAIFGVGEEDRIIAYCKGLAGAVPLPRASVKGRFEPLLYREGLSPFAAPLKVAEGCSRRCSYCVIPAIRGPFRPRAPEEIIKEAEQLLKSGIRELMLVAQDLTAYRWKGYGLSALLRDLASLKGDFWIRPMYLYPLAIDGRLLSAIAETPKVCKYIDMPVQHSEEKVLRAMKRGGGREAFLGLVRRIRRTVPGVTLRTSIIVGFPGEGAVEFKGLMEFVREAEFDRLGVFKYSREEGTPAYLMKGQAPERVKQSRLDALMRLQAGISLEKNMALIGKKVRVLIEEVDGETAVGRACSQAPEIDGQVVVRGVRGARGLKPGSFHDILMDRAYTYDMEGEPCR